MMRSALKSHKPERKRGPKPRPAAQLRSARLDLFVTPGERSAVQQAAKDDVLTVPAWLRRVVLQAAAGHIV